MTGKDTDPSGYISSVKSIIDGSYFVAGFAFTVMTLLLTQLKDPTSVFFQIVLLLLNILQDLSIFLAAWYTIHLATLSAYSPHVTKGMNAATFLTFIIALLGTLITTLLFYFFGLPSLGLASLIAWLVQGVSAYVFIMKPAQKLDSEMRKREET